jgi:hypothetical protein
MQTVYSFPLAVGDPATQKSKSYTLYSIVAQSQVAEQQRGSLCYAVSTAVHNYWPGEFRLRLKARNQVKEIITVFISC